MGREVRRTPMGFDWPLGKVWFGYVLPSVECQLCDGKEAPYVPGATYCVTCEGEGTVCARIDPPTGAGWQMWETTSEGSPISPVCETPEALATWLAGNSASAFGSDTATYSQWLGMIRAGWAPSMVLDSNGLRSGVAACEGNE